MNERQAHELVRSIEHLWSYDMGADGRATWTQALTRYDSPLASEAILKLSERQRDRPTLADVRNMVAKIQRDRIPESRAREIGAGSQTLPPWVKRWACARYLYARFNRKQDMRRFREVGDWADPTIPLMPEDEWRAEADSITDMDVLGVIRRG